MMSTLLYLYNSIKRGDILTLTDRLECRHDIVDVNTILPTHGVGILHLAVGIEPLEASEQCSEIILRNGGDPNLRSEEGLTPVHIAAIWGRLDNLRVLVAWGGDISVRDADEKTPYDYAVEEGHWDICDYLLGIAADHGEKNKVATGNVIAEYGESEKRDGLKSEGRCHKTQMVRDWCDHNLQLCDTGHSIYNDHSMLLNDSILWNSLVEKHKTKEVSGIDRIEFLCNSDNAMYSCLYNVNEKITNNAQIDRRSIFDNFSLPGSPTNIVHKNYSNKSCIKKIYSADEYDKNEISLELLYAELEIQDNSHKGNVEIKDESIIIEDKDVCDDGIQRISDEETSVSIHEIYSISSLKVSDSCNNTGSLLEDHGHIEEQQGMVLQEEQPPEHSPKFSTEVVEERLSSHSSTASSMPASVDYDPTTLRLELTQCGYNPGPINHSTKRLYLKKLKNLRKNPLVTKNAAGKTYSVELQKTLSETGWCSAAWREAGGELERTAMADFTRRGAAWREGAARTSFTYLLLDPRVTCDLPSRARQQPETLVWQTFVDSIFYVGKGKRSRPYSHLHQAIDLWKRDLDTCQVVNKKVQHILDVWKSGSGVVCLHVFQNVIPAEAYTYEAAMIDVLGLTNLKNLKAGNYYGVVSSWPLKDRRRLGVYLLYKAMQIFLSEGERQLRPEDLD